jgi:hypothetical protein
MVWVALSAPNVQKADPREGPQMAETVVCDRQLGGVTNPDVNFRGDESGRSAVGARPLSGPTSRVTRHPKPACQLRDPDRMKGKPLTRKRGG